MVSASPIYNEKHMIGSGDLAMTQKEDQTEQDMPLEIRDVMVREVITLNGNASVKEAADIMNEFEIGSLIVVNNEGKAVGIVTERDILKRVVAEEKNAKKTKISEIMSSPLVVVESNIEVEEAVKLMFQMKIKKLAAVDGNKLVGIVSLTDIARVQPQIIKTLKQLADSQLTPKNIKKVIDYYVV